MLISVAIVALFIMMAVGVVLPTLSGFSIDNVGFKIFLFLYLFEFITSSEYLNESRIVVNGFNVGEGYCEIIRENGLDKVFFSFELVFIIKLVPK